MEWSFIIWDLKHATFRSYSFQSFTISPGHLINKIIEHLNDSFEQNCILLRHSVLPYKYFTYNTYRVFFMILPSYPSDIQYTQRLDSFLASNVISLHIIK